MGDTRTRHRMASLVASALALGATVAVLAAPTPADAAADDGNIVAVPPARLLETRTNQASPTVDGKFDRYGRVPAGGIVPLDVAGRGGVDPDASAAYLNVTAVNPGADGHLTVYPCTEQVPESSNVNYVPGGAVANSVVAKLSASGKVCIFSHAAVDIVVDVSGYVPAGAAPIPVEPARLVETRKVADRVTVDHQYEGIGRVAGGTSVKFKVWERGQEGDEVPTTAEAVFLNVTAIRPGGPGHFTVYPCTDSVPEVSNLNYVTNQTVPNSVLATVSDDGHVCIYTHADADLIADVNAYLPAGGNRTAIEPARCADTRPPEQGGRTFDGLFLGAGRQAAGSVYAVTIAGRCGIPDAAVAAYINVTAVNPSGNGHLTVWPCDEPQPGSSNVNYVAGTARPNAALSKISLDGNGQICIFTLAETHLIVDVNGYVPPPSPGFTQVAHSGNIGCGVDSDGGVICWGHNLYEALPGFTALRDNSTQEQPSVYPYRVPNLSNVTEVSLYGYRGCALLEDATAVCWGQGTNGERGDGKPFSGDDGVMAGPNPVVGTSGSGKLGNLTKIVTGARHSCALDSTGTAYCWGRAAYDALGTGGTTTTSTPAPVTVIPPGRTVDDIAVSNDSTCALLDDESVLCWGFAADGIYSFLGDGDGDNGGVVMTDAAATSPLAGVDSIDGRASGFCAVRTNGTVWCWGSNFYGQLGDGTTAERSHAVQVKNVSGAVQVSGGQKNNCAVTDAGTSICWGAYRGFGPDNPDSDAPLWWTAPLSGDAVSVDATSDGTACWLLDDGFAMCAGGNFNYRLGFPTDSGAGQRNPGFVQSWLAD